MQAAINYPLTVHGTGGQTEHLYIFKILLNMMATPRNPPKDRVKINNQMTESHKGLSWQKLFQN